MAFDCHQRLVLSLRDAHNPLNSSLSSSAFQIWQVGFMDPYDPAERDALYEVAIRVQTSHLCHRSNQPPVSSFKPANRVIVQTSHLRHRSNQPPVSCLSASHESQKTSTSHLCHVSKRRIKVRKRRLDESRHANPTARHLAAASHLCHWPLTILLTTLLCI